jgi:outer membrane cobalamin receptor
MPSSARRVAFDAGVRTDIVEGAGVQPTGSVGATWRVLGSPSGSAWSLLARGAQAVRVPTLYDLYFSSPQRLTVRALDPERVTLDASGGTQAVWQRTRWRVVGEATLVSRDTRNAIVWFPGNFGWSPANVGLERLRGTESRLDITTAQWSVSGWHTWYRSELRSGAMLIPTPYVPRHSMATNAAWRVGAHTLSANVRYQGRRPFTAGPRNPLFELPGVTVADVAWSQRQAFARVEALWSLTLDNVTDVQWQSVRGFPMPGRGWSASLTLAPRS